MEPPKAAGNGGASCSMTSVFGGHQTSLKGEDGLRVERLTIGSDKIVAAAVCDGHGGHEASALVIEEMLPRLQAEAAGDASMAALGAAAERVFLSLHATLNEPERGITAGTTATLILVNESRSEITSAAVGDSFAALYEAPSAEAKSVMTTSLTANHRLECNETERARVRAAGGKLGRARTRDGIEAGPIRAWPGGIACARAIGDSDCGGLVLARVGVRARPAHALRSLPRLAPAPRTLDLHTAHRTLARRVPLAPASATAHRAPHLPPSHPCPASAVPRLMPGAWWRRSLT
jgi:serine/threonine protein phosphatase PrpC